MKHPRFWMVWSPQGRAPTFSHHCKESAETEARRLADRCPGQQFFILKAVAGFTSSVTIEPIELVKSADEEIPF